MSLREKIKYFMKGVGSVLQIYPEQIKLEELFPYYNAKTPQEKDAQALASDCAEIGKDLENSIKKFGEQIYNGNKKS